MKKQLSPTAQWMQDHPNDTPPQRSTMAAAAGWRKKRGILESRAETGSKPPHRRTGEECRVLDRAQITNKANNKELEMNFDIERYVEIHV